VCDRVKVKDADYDGLEGAGLVLITSGVNEKTGGAIDRSDPEGRIKLLDQNAAIYREIVPQMPNSAFSSECRVPENAERCRLDVDLTSFADRALGIISGALQVV
jgi:lactate/malate dehydrogenase, NAD binding domain